jgi:aspartate-semialdehyde dehydrogenase
MKIAIVGATGLVGTNIINLCEKYFDADVEYSFFASKSSEGKKIKINDKEVTVKELNKENIGEYNISLFSAGGERSKDYAHNFIKKGSFVVDNSSVFRMNDEVPLVVYGINENIITEESKLISNPNCTTMGLVMALKPLHDKYTLSSMTPVAYQAVSGSGSEAIKSLEKETLLGDKLDANYQQAYYSNPIARNVIPLAGSLTDNGYSDEEMKFVHESRKILSIPDLVVEPSNARVGVRTGHGTFCSAVFENEVDLEECTDLLKNFEGVEVWNDSLPTPLDVEGKDEVLVSRLRLGLSSKNILNFWVVSDNLLKGAALNAVQIAKFVEKL